MLLQLFFLQLGAIFSAIVTFKIYVSTNEHASIINIATLEIRTRLNYNYRARINCDSGMKRLLPQDRSLHQSTDLNEGVEENMDEALLEGLFTAPRTKPFPPFNFYPGVGGTLYPPFKTPVARLVLLEKTDKPMAVQFS